MSDVEVRCLPVDPLILWRVVFGSLADLWGRVVATLLGLAPSSNTGCSNKGRRPCEVQGCCAEREAKEGSTGRAVKSESKTWPLALVARGVLQLRLLRRPSLIDESGGRDSAFVGRSASDGVEGPAEAWERETMRDFLELWSLSRFMGRTVVEARVLVLPIRPFRLCSSFKGGCADVAQVEGLGGF